MRIGTLAGTELPYVIDVFLRAFEGYFVPLPTDPAYWEDRFRSARVDLSGSFGAFDGDELVAFVIHGFGTLNGHVTAFNTGTGVLPAYRGRRLVDAIYEAAIPALRERGVTRSTLEVITKNAVAVRLYERLGFRVEHLWHSFSGTLATQPTDDVLVSADLRTADLGTDAQYSWDYSEESVLRAPERWQYYTLNGDVRSGHVVLDTAAGRIARLGVANEDDDAQWQRLFAGLSIIRRELKVINVHPDRALLLRTLLGVGLAPVVDQYQMQRTL